MKKTILYCLLLGVTAALLCSYDPPKGWFKAGSAPEKYDMGVDAGAGRNGKNAATIKSTARRIWGFGTLMQSCDATKYLGKRVKMSGYMKSEDVDKSAGFWFRVDGPNKKRSLSFDNMYDRPVTGTTGWKKYEIVLDVPDSATQLAYGALISGTGQIWFENLEFEVVSESIPQTGRKRDEPQNLNFDEK